MPRGELGQRLNFFRCSQGLRSPAWINGISSVLFPYVVLLSSSSQDLRHVPEQFAAECEAAGSQLKKCGLPSMGCWEVPASGEGVQVSQGFIL